MTPETNGGGRLPNHYPRPHVRTSNLPHRSIGVLVLCVSLLLNLPAVQAATGEGETWPVFNESNGCEQLRTEQPFASRSGYLSNDEPVRGPFGDFFGRTIGEVRSHLVYWDVPMSDGERLLVHEYLLPAFQQVTANLAAEQAKGRYYAIKKAETYAFAPRTVSGSYRLSYHALGSAVDINSRSNPYRSDNRLITNMPDWFVQAWRDAGFCWGGDWLDIKDPMHFAWKGPSATPGYSEVPPAAPPRSGSASFADLVSADTTPFGVPEPQEVFVIADGSGDGAMDLFRFEPRPEGTLIEFVRSSKEYHECGISRYFALGAYLDRGSVLVGDFDRSGYSDVWWIDRSRPVADVSVYLRADGFEGPQKISTSIPNQPDDVFLLGDWDGDGYSDLFVVRRDSTTTGVEIWDGASGFATRVVSSTTRLGATNTSTWHFALSDRDRDGLLDLHAVRSGAGALEVNVVGGAGGFLDPATVITGAQGGNPVDIAFQDYDGDGRDDFQMLAADGRLRILLGNERVWNEMDSWFVSPTWECPDEWEPYDYSGAFRDDDGSMFEADIEWLAGAGITVGCNPPYNDEYCPTKEVTRAQIATFLVRALNLPAATADYFSDDGPPHEANINSLAESGITLGCAEGRFCPSDPISREQMATLLVRALNLPASSTDFFLDDGPPHEANINALAQSRITLGCAEGRYCPHGVVTRAQMAAFLARAFRDS